MEEFNLQMPWIKNFSKGPLNFHFNVQLSFVITTKTQEQM